MNQSLSREQMIRRISAEYLEMPGLRLTCEQAQRLWAIDADNCRDVLSELVRTKFLSRSADGRYTRASEGAVVFPVPRMARAALSSARDRSTRRTG